MSAAKTTSAPPRRRVGIVGFGALGQYLVEHILTDPKVTPHFELAFVWNRSIEKVTEYNSAIIATTITDKKDVDAASNSSSKTSFTIPADAVLKDLNQFESKGADLIVEVAHPNIYQTFGEKFLKAADLFVGSPTAFADGDVFRALSSLAKSDSTKSKNDDKNSDDKKKAFDTGMYLPCGALWGAEDIAKMGERGNITGLTITMTKPPESMKLEEPLQTKVNEFLANKEKSVETIYAGPVRDICPLAPNNVNTMAFAALASGIGLGFDKCVGKLVADKNIAAHIIEIEVVGLPLPGREDEPPFHVYTKRYNPCNPNAVTASATYASFLSSLVRAGLHRGNGIFFC